MDCLRNAFANRHPVALFFLFFFRVAAVAVYLLCGFFVSSCEFGALHQSLQQLANFAAFQQTCSLYDSKLLYPCCR